MEAVERDLGRYVSADADQQRNAYCVQRPRGRDPDGYKQKRVWEAQLPAPQPAVECEECGNESYALVSGTFLQDTYVEIAGTQNEAVDVEDNIGLVQAQDPMRCVQRPAGETVPACQGKPAA